MTNMSIEESIVLAGYSSDQDIKKNLEAFENTFQDLSDLFSSDTKKLMRTPVEIKKDIKHEKNHMKLKQLNRELNDSYKAFRFRKGINKNGH